MSPDDREDSEDTRPRGEYDEEGLEDTLREVPAEEPADDETLENRPVDDTLVQGGDGPTRSTHRSSTPAPASGEPTEPRTQARPEGPAGGGAEVELERTEILGERAEVFAGRFEVLKTIGQGGMGRVYAVRDRQIEGRKVALKILLPKFSRNEDFRRLFFDEIRANQKFVSEYVVQIRDTGQAADGHLFLTMDLVDGISLASLIKREGALQPRHGLEIARQVLLGLQPGHEKGIIHRDIKPSNVMLVSRVTKTEDNPFGVAVRLLDFGIAAIASDLTPGQIIGTPQYMSPEQLEGERLDQRTDLFSVGVLLYEMISGQRPFGGTTLQEISRALRETQIPDLVRNLEGLPKPIQKVLHKALQKDRNKRYQSAAEFIAAIESSSAFKEPTKVPAWSSVLLVLMTGVAAIEGYYIMKTETQALSNEALRDARQRQDQRIAALEAENLSLRERLETATDAKIDTGDREGDIKLLQASLKQVREDAQEAKKERDTLEQRMLNKDKEIADLRAVNDRLQEEVSRVASLREGDAKLATCFDGLMLRIEGRQFDVLDDYLQRQRDDYNVFVKPGEDGYALVDELVATASALAAQDPKRARAALEAARDADTRTGFEIGSENWIDAVWGDEEQDAESAAAERFARLDAALEQLAGEIEALEARLAEERANAERALRELPVEAETADVVALYERHGDLDLEPFLERFAEHARERIVGGGRFDVGAAIELGRLDDWARWLAGPGVRHDGVGARAIRELRAAQAWYEDGTAPPRSMFRLADVGGARDWRARLALQLAFASGDAAWPPASNDRAVYRQRFVKADAVAWIDEQLTGKPGSDTWALERTFYHWDPTGRRVQQSQPDQIQRTGDVFVGEGGREIVDLRSTGRELRVAHWDPRVGPFEEKRHAFTRGLDLDGFADRVRGETIPCLVATQTGVEYWLSPRYGLVREIREGVHERELVYTANPR